MKITVLTVDVSGPLAEHAVGFADELQAAGYTVLSRRNQLRLLAHLSRWLGEQGLGAGDLEPELVARFARERRVAGYTGFRSERALRPLLGHLRRTGASPEESAAAAPEGTVDRLLARYRTHLVAERGLTEGTVLRYEAAARAFLTRAGASGELGPEALNGATVGQYVLAESRRRSIGTTKYTVTALRSLLRFLHLEGLCGALADAVPTVAGWRGSHLPRGLAAEQVRALLESCDRATVSGRRDLAMLTLLVRLALRSHEVAELRFDDFDWRRGELVVRGKGRQEERLPLPVDVGEAVVQYLLASPPEADCPYLFRRAQAPRGPVSHGAVKAVVREACRRAGLEPVGAHRLRHTAATEMLRAGASLAEVGQVLRHRALSTTAIYAKVDRARLRELARPWPGVAA